MSLSLNHHQTEELLVNLKNRFVKYQSRHSTLKWEVVEARIRSNDDKLWTLFEMERTGGEPDVIGLDSKSGDYFFVDCSEESPKGRRSLCYDHRAWEGRKVAKPAGNAINMADSMGLKMLDEDQYRHLQTLGEFDLKTSSWILTPENIRKRGGALFMDRRYDHVFTYHNGADSYYAARGFRGFILI